MEEEKDSREYLSHFCAELNLPSTEMFMFPFSIFSLCFDCSESLYPSQRKPGPANDTVNKVISDALVTKGATASTAILFTCLFGMLP